MVALGAVGAWIGCRRAAAGIESMRLHDLRHFYASGLIAAGCDVVTVQRALGHKSATVTLSTTRTSGRRPRTVSGRPPKAWSSALLRTPCGLRAKKPRVTRAVTR